MDIYYMSDVENKYNSGHYEAKVPEGRLERFANDHVFDEDKSVRWNRTEAFNRNAAADKARQEKIEMQRQLDKEFMADMVSVMVKAYKLKQSVAQYVLDITYEKYHSNMREFFEEIFNAIEFTTEVIKRDNED